MIGDPNCFTPISFEEMRIKTYQADALLDSQKANISDEVHTNLQKILTTDPQAVIQHCQKMTQLQLDGMRVTDLQKYTELSKAYLKMPNQVINSEITKQLNEISSRHLNDEKFNKAIENNDLLKSVRESLLENKASKDKNIIENQRGFER